MKAMNKEIRVPFSCKCNNLLYSNSLFWLGVLFVKLIYKCMVVLLIQFFITHAYKALSIVFSVDTWVISLFEHCKYRYYK